MTRLVGTKSQPLPPGAFSLPLPQVNCRRPEEGIPCMRGFGSLLIVLLALLIGGGASAQDTRGYVGVELKDLTKEEAEKLGWEGPRGARVVKPQEGGPAAAAGILPEDVITTLDGQEVENLERFMAAIAAKAPGAQVRLRVLRGGRERTVTVTVGR